MSDDEFPVTSDDAAAAWAVVATADGEVKINPAGFIASFPCDSSASGGEPLDGDPHLCTDYELCKHCGQCHGCCGCY